MPIKSVIDFQDFKSNVPVKPPILHLIPLKNNFEIILSGVSAYPFSKEFVGRKIDKRFVEEMKLLSQKYFINPAAEGGEFETLVLNCPLFKKKLCIKLTSILGENYSYRGLFE